MAAAALDVDSGTSNYFYAANFFPGEEFDDDLHSQVVQFSGGSAGSEYDAGPAEAPAFDVSDYITAFDELVEESSPAARGISLAPSTVMEENEENAKRMKMEVGERIGFRTKSDVDVLDDGFKWRKYGKKSVKSSPNPRNYYRCTSVGCGVRKRVERDRNDARYVITSYEGVHNHIRPDGSSATNKNYRSNSSATNKNYRSSSNAAVAATAQAKPPQQPHDHGGILAVVPDAWSLMMLQSANLLA